MVAFTLQFQALGSISGPAPLLEVLLDGVVVSSNTITSTSQTFNDSFSSTDFPSSISFRFLNSSGSASDTISITSATLNGTSIIGTSNVDGLLLQRGQDTNILGRVEPTTGDLGTTTITGTGGDDNITGETPGGDVIDTGNGNDRVVGLNDNDAIIGGSGVDRIFGQGGDDVVIAGGGNDLIFGGDGNDALYGQGDNDRLIGGDGNDTLNGGSGNDGLLGDAGNDALFGEDGDDFLIGGAGEDTIYGDEGADNISGGADADIIFGGDDDDKIDGGAGDDLIDAGTGDDLVSAGTGDDVIDGEDGDDTIYGGDNDDIINGQDDNDDLFGDDGNDTLNGGDGEDVLNGGDGSDILTGGNGNDNIFGDNGTFEFDGNQIVIELENFESSIARSGHEWVVVDDGNASGGKAIFVDNNGGNNIFNTDTETTSPELTYTVNFTSTGTYYVWVLGSGPSGSDDSVHIGLNGVRTTTDGGLTGFNGGTFQWGNVPTFGGGRVTINVTSTGEQTINIFTREDGVTLDKLLLTSDAGFTPSGFGPDESERVSTSGGIDNIDGGAGDDLIYGDFGDDIISGGNDDDRIYGGDGADDIDGDDGDDRLIGGDGIDTIDGGNDDDYIEGNDDDDILNGDAGNDTIIGGAGADTMDGGANDDTFILVNGDFAAGESITGGANIDDISLSGSTTVDFTIGTLNTVETISGSDDDDDVTLSWEQFNDLTSLDLDLGTDSQRILFSGTLDITAETIPTGSGIENGFLVGSTGADELTATGAQINSLVFGSGIINFDGGTDILNLTSTSTDLNTLGLTDASVQGLEEISALTASAGVTIDMSGQVEGFTLTGSNNGTDIISGGAGNDIINGRAGTNTINAGAGDDVVTGQFSATNTVTLGAGMDTYNGNAAAGVDTLFLANGDFVAGESIFTGNFSQGNQNTAGVDELILTNATTVDFTIGSLSGIDIFTGSSGADDVTIDITTLGQMTTVDLDGGTDTIRTQINGTIDMSVLNTPTINNTENGFLVGSTNADTLTASGAQLDSLIYGIGTINFGNSNDILNLTTTSVNLNTLGATDSSVIGLEEITALTAGAGVTINMFGQTEDFTMRGSDFDDIFTGGSGADFLKGNQGDDTLIGNDGIDTLEGNAGDDIITGGAGADIITAGGNSDTINLANGDFAAGESIDGGGGTDEIVLTNATTIDFTTGTLTDIETITGSGGNDDVTIGMDQLIGLSSLNLQGGADALDMLVTGTLDVTAATFPGSIVAETKDLSGSAGVDIFTVTGGQLNTILLSTSSIIDFGGSSDTLSLTTTSTDFNTTGSTADGRLLNLETIDTLNATANVTVNLSAQTEDFTFTGGTFDDIFTGGSGVDTVDGGAGNDIITGSVGSDILNGGIGNDTIYALDNTVNINAIGATLIPTSVTDFSAAFGTGNDGFTYVEVNDPANVTVTGSRETGDGGIANGSLEVDIQGSNGAFTNAEGYWTQTITFSEDLNNAELNFSYRHLHANQNDVGEDSSVYYNIGAGDVILSTALGSAGATDTGWQTITVSLGDVTVGSTVTLRLGLIHVGSNRNNEDATARFDDVSIAGDSTTSGTQNAGTATIDADSTHSNILSGGAGVDTLYGSSGNDTLNGDSGTDTLYSGTVDLLTAELNSILAANPSVSYNFETGNFYQFVSSTVTLASATANASASTLNGVAGHLVTITSANENAFVFGLTGGTETLIGATDSASEGTWLWSSGGYESGAQFSDGSGNAVNGWYENWQSGDPNGAPGDGDAAIINAFGTWFDRGTAESYAYVIEWEGSDVFASLNTNTLNGGADDDDLYGSDGIDIFEFDNTTSTDTVFNFNTLGRDKIDISDVISYDPLTDDIADYVQISESGGDTTISVDADGSGGYTDIAILDSVTGLDLYELITADNLIVS